MKARRILLYAALFVGVVSLFCFTSPARGQTYTWDGSNNMYTSPDWLPGSVVWPGTGNAVINSGQVEVDDSNFNAGQINIAAGAQLYLNGSSMTQGGSIVLSGTTAGGAIYSGNLPGGNINILAGTITLAANSNIANWWNDKTLEFDGQITGPGGLTFDCISGNVGGSFYLTNSANNYQGNTTVNGATGPLFGYTGQARLFLGANNALPATTTLTLNNADLYLNGNSQQLPSIGGAGTSYNVYNGSTTGGTLTLGVGGASSVFNGAINDNGHAMNDSNSSGPNIIGTVALVKTGSGNLTLTNSNNYSDVTTVNGGLLALAGSGAINTSSGITVNGPTAKFLQNSSVAVTPGILLSQGTLDGTGTVGNVAVAAGAANTVAAGNGSSGTLTTGNLTFNGAATVSLPAASILNVTGALSVSGSAPVTINTSNTAWAAGSSYELIGYGSYTPVNFGTDFAVGTVGGLGSRQTAVLTNSTSSDQIDLTITGNTTYWSGSQSSAWTTNRSVLNFVLDPAGSSTYYEDGDAPKFDDRATGSTTVNITDSNVNPNSVTFGNLNKSYTLQSTGGFGITGSGSVNISGGGGVTISNSNGYTGGTTLSNGLLNLANSAAIGSGPLTITGGSLDNTTGSAMTANNAQFWNGSFTFVGSAPLNLGTGAVTLNGSATALVNASTLTVGGAIEGGGALTKNGTGTLVLAGNSGFAGGMTLNNGMLVLSQSNATGNGPLTINGGTLDSAVGGVSLSNNAQTWNADIIFNGTQSLNMGTGAVTLGSSRTVTVNANTLTVGGALSDSGSGYSLTKAGAGTLVLQGQSTYTGGTFVNGGVLNLNAGGSAGTIRGPLTINPGATVQLNQGDALGYGGGSAVTTVSVSGATINNSTGNSNGYITNFILTGGTMSSSGGGYYNFTNGYGITTLASTATSLISSNITIRDTNNLDFNVAAGNTASGIDLLVNAGIYENYPWTIPNGIIKDGPGVMYVTGQLQYIADTTVNNGKLILASMPGDFGGFTPSASQPMTYTVASGATLDFRTSSSMTSYCNSNFFTGGGTITTSGPGTVNLNSYNGDANTWSLSPGALINVASGTFQLTDGYNGSNDFSNNYSSLNIGAGALFNSANAVQVDALTGAGTYQGGYYGYSNLTVGVANGSGTFSGVIEGNGYTYGGHQFVSLIKVGTGIQTLSGDNLYDGGTTINGGTLAVAGAGTLGAPTGNLTMGGGALNLGGGSQTVAAVSITAAPASGNTIQNGTLTANSFAVSNPSGIVTVTANLEGSGAALTMSGGGELILSGDDNYGGGTIVSGGTLIAATAAALPNGSSLTVGNASVLGGLSQGPALAVVPEPGTLALLLVGLIAGLVWRMRKGAWSLELRTWN